MSKPALIIMAAGIGSRYGGLKQIDPIGPNGELIIDYSIYDALRAGFGKLVFVLKKDIEEAFRERIGKRIEKLVDTDYVFQSLEDVPKGFSVPPERKKPWGTGHAVLSCRKVVNTPFAVINADDFYGRDSFNKLYGFLKDAEDKGGKGIESKDRKGVEEEGGVYNFCMVGFLLENTLTEHGHVARGVCAVDSGGYLVDVHERTKIQKFGKAIKYAEDDGNWVTIPSGSIASLNTWGFTPGMFGELEARFPEFLQLNASNIIKAEYFLPEVVGALLADNKAKVKVLTSDERWYGVTYQEDKPLVKQAINKLVGKGIYPEKLWM